VPNRILREGILDSEAVCSLSVHAEVLYRRLMSVHDDFGRFDARLNFVKSKCYPIRSGHIAEADIALWLQEIESAKLVVMYEVDGKRYGQFLKTEPPRAKKSKFPAPPEHLLASARTCMHMRPYSNSIPYSNPSPRSSASDGQPPHAEVPEVETPSGLGEAIEAAMGLTVVPAESPVDPGSEVQATAQDQAARRAVNQAIAALQNVSPAMVSSRQRIAFERIFRAHGADVMRECLDYCAGRNQGIPRDPWTYLNTPGGKLKEILDRRAGADPPTNVKPPPRVPKTQIFQ
jgi:hypothetical protein